MPSLLPGFEYDIFISYRQNDNRSGWVTEFVKSLQEELASTIKEPVSIYFDTNPHDGLLETHNVDKSLEGKLKCLIFIPIISQTYCDPKSFAWQHEFCAFNRLAKEDQFGRDIKLSNGNVASRILPIKIHDLDAEDKSLLENELGGVLRAIEFIYRSAGVNRPLTSRDDEVRTPGKILYRDQANKAANAIKEVIISLKKTGLLEPTVGQPPKFVAENSNPFLNNKKKIAVIVTLLALVWVVYYYGSQRSSLKDPSNSGVAILPFKNNTGSPDLDYYGIGMASEIRTRLSLSKQFKFLSSLQATLPYLSSTKSTGQIGEELGVDYLISGLYQKAGSKIKVEVELVNAENGQVIWALPLERELNDLFQVQAEIAEEILTRFSNTRGPEVEITKTTNLEAYAHYIRGNQLLENVYTDSSDWKIAYYPGIAQFEKGDRTGFWVYRCVDRLN